jgi:uncharacterized protein YkuJ
VELDKIALTRLDSMQQEVGNKRVRPLEVAGAALAEGDMLPVAYEQAFELSKVVEAKLRGNRN